MWYPTIRGVVTYNRGVATLVLEMWTPNVRGVANAWSPTVMKIVLLESQELNRQPIERCGIEWTP